MCHWRVSVRTLTLVLVSIGSAGAHATDFGVRQPTPDLGRAVTLRGCLKSWDGSPTGVGRRAPGQPPQFVLTDVEASPVALAPSPVGSSGTATPPATTAPMAHGTYVVQAAQSRLELGPHLDQHVEVTGTLEVIPPHDASESGGKQGNPTPAATAPRTGAVAPSVPGSRAEAPVPGRAPLQRVVAATIKTVATSCP